MQTSKIEIGGDYAYKRDSYSTPQRVRVLAVKQPREVYDSSWSRYAKKVNDGVKVQFLNADGAERTRTKTTYQDVEVTPARVARNGAVVPAVTEHKAVHEQVPDVDVVRPALITGTWEKAVDDMNTTRLYKERVEASNQKTKTDTEKAQAWAKLLLGRTSITGTGEYSNTAGRYVYGAPKINVDELLNLLRLADLAVSAGLDTQE